MIRTWISLKSRLAKTTASRATVINNDKLHRDIADEYRMSKNWDLAAHYYTLHLELHPQDFDIWVQLGHAAKESGDFARAQAAYHQAAHINANDSDLNLHMGHLAKVVGDYESAAKHYTISAELEPSSEALHELNSPLIAQYARSRAATNQREGATMTEANLVGYVDYCSDLTVSGWLIRSFIKNRFFVEDDGRKLPLHLKFHTRPDLMASNLDALAFEAILPPDLSGIDAKIGFEGEGGVVYLKHSQTSDERLQIVASDPELAVVRIKDLGALLSAIDADTEEFLCFGERYPNVIAASGQVIDVLFIDGSHGSSSIRYRVINIAEGLKELHQTACYVRLDKIDFKIVSRLNARVAVFFRAPLDEFYRHIVDSFRAKGTSIVYDIDDLVFDKSIVSTIDGIRYLSAEQFEGYMWGVEHYRKFVLEADIITAPTQYLCDYITRTMDKKTFKVVNSIGKRFIEKYSHFEHRGAGSRKDFIVGYYSGSKTHQVDFAQAAPGLTRFMKIYQNARLRLVGLLEISEFPDLQAMSDRIDLVPIMPYHLMIEDMGFCDVVLAPLIAGDAFCEAKSELKFFESALRSRVCVASPTDAFRNATADGAFGLLASTPEQWFERLEELYHSYDRRRELAKLAYKRAISEYHYLRAGRQAFRAYFGLDNITEDGDRQSEAYDCGSSSNSTRARRASVAGPLSLAVVVPEIFSGSGGLRKILRFCHDWANQGHRVTLYVDSTRHPEQIKADICNNYFNFEFVVRNFKGAVQDHDAYICTHWSTAYALRNFKSPEQVIYFVQDFEPMFDAVSTNYAKALATYQMGFHIACYGDWVSSKLRQELSLSPISIPFTMDRSLYAPAATGRKSIDVLFFARPSQPRRCFELGVEALRLAFKANRTLRIGLYGEPDYGDLGFPYQNFGLITDLGRIAELYRRSNSGICFSTTNPSLVGYEMLSSGLPLVDLRMPGYEANFGGEEFVYYANATPESIVSTIGRALTFDDQREFRIAQGIEFVGRMPADDEIGAQLMSAIEQHILPASKGCLG